MQSAEHQPLQDLLRIEEPAKSPKLCKSLQPAPSFDMMEFSRSPRTSARAHILEGRGILLGGSEPSLVVGPSAEEDVGACCGHSLGASDVGRPAFSVQLRPCMAACVQCPEVAQHWALLGCPRKNVEPVTYCSQGVQAPAQHARGHLSPKWGVSCLFAPQMCCGRTQATLRALCLGWGIWPCEHA